MKLPRNQITLSLILSSLVLLVVLQGFWIRSAYLDEARGLQRETQILFRNILFEMSDSLMEKSIEPLKADTAVKMYPRKRMTGWPDTVKNVQFFVYSSNGSDSVAHYLRPIISKLRSNPNPQTFSIRLRQDSLSTGDVEHKFRQALHESGIDLTFRVENVDPRVGPPLQPHDLKPDQVIFTPSGAFRADFTNLNWLILKKITPQILFAVFLTVLTAGSFVILYRSLRSQQRLMQLKNDFISNVTHELKTPVTTVGVAIEALKNFSGLENPRLTREYLDIAQQELNRLSILTDKILKTAIFEDKGVDLQPEAIDFEKLVDQVVASLKLVFEKQGAEVTVEKEGTDFMMTGSAVHLTNVIYNLLDNALKYSPGNPTIAIRLTGKPDVIVISVEDNGIGIRSEHHQKVFEKFFRVPTGDVHNIKGYGLGLSYVATVIRSHQGTLALDSEPGRGSKFTITIPKTLKAK